MIQTEVVFSNAGGLHLRVATMICKAAREHASSVFLKRNAEKVDCKSGVFDMLSLSGDSIGATMTLVVDGEDERQATDDIVALFDAKFNEE